MINKIIYTFVIFVILSGCATTPKRVQHPVDEVKQEETFEKEYQKQLQQTLGEMDLINRLLQEQIYRDMLKQFEYKQFQIQTPTTPIK